jgi:hypothetical protein
MFNQPKTLLHVGFFFGVDRYRSLHYNKHMSTQKPSPATLQQELEKSNQIRNLSWSFWLTVIATAAIIVAC